jgi:hypothetical protein
MPRTPKKPARRGRPPLSVKAKRGRPPVAASKKKRKKVAGSRKTASKYLAAKTRKPKTVAFSAEVLRFVEAVEGISRSFELLVARTKANDFFSRRALTRQPSKDGTTWVSGATGEPFTEELFVDTPPEEVADF